MKLIGVLRILCAVTVIACGAVVCACAILLSRKQFRRIAMFWHRAMLWSFATTPVHRSAAPVRGALLLSNHISWLDISVLGASWDVVFLGNSEILNWYVLGWVIKRAGTLFITRGSGAPQAINEISAALTQQRTVILFPEGRTGRGDSVMRFQPRLAQAAVDARAPVQPVALRYVDAAGHRIARHSFAGDIGLWSSVWKTVCGAKIFAEVTVFPPVTVPDGGDSRQALVTEAERIVRESVETPAAGAANPPKNAA